MADFKTHITTSTVIGVGYGVAGYTALELPPATCILGAGLCSLAGMLPDLDSDSGVPVRETMAFAAAIVPLLMVDRFAHLGWSFETMVLAGAGIYLGIRFGVAEIFRRYTVHRGMWHSLPAAVTAGLLAFLICSCSDEMARYFKAVAVFVGFLSHLVLDEFWSVSLRWGRLRFKKSFGTALKLWSRSTWANVSTYAKLLILAFAAFYDPVAMERFERYRAEAQQNARDLLEQARQDAQQLLR